MNIWPQTKGIRIKDLDGSLICKKGKNTAPSVFVCYVFPCSKCEQRVIRCYFIFLTYLSSIKISKPSLFLWLTFVLLTDHTVTILLYHSPPKSLTNWLCMHSILAWHGRKSSNAISLLYGGPSTWAFQGIVTSVAVHLSVRPGRFYQRHRPIHDNPAGPQSQA